MALALGVGAPFTYEDLQEMPDDGHRRELVDGMLLVTPAPVPLHQRCVLRLAAALLAAAPEDLEVLTAPLDWMVSDSTVFQPDVLVARRNDVGATRLERTPLLVVEVLSPSTRLTDLGTQASGLRGGWGTVLLAGRSPPAEPDRPAPGCRSLRRGGHGGRFRGPPGDPPVDATVVPALLVA